VVEGQTSKVKRLPPPPSTLVSFDLRPSTFDRVRASGAAVAERVNSSASRY